MKRNRWFVSVILAGLVVSGAAYAHDGDGRDGQGMPPHHGPCGKLHLSEAQQQLLHETMMKTLEKDKALFEKMHSLHRQLHDVLAAETFDSKAFESLSARLEETRDRIHKDRVHAFASIAGQFTPQEREMLAKWHKHHHGYHHGGPGNHDEHDGQHAGWHHDGDGQGWNHDHAWQQQQPTSDAVTFSPPSDDRAYPPYATR